MSLTMKTNQSTESLSKDINVITAEINSYKQIAGQAIFEIGRRLYEVKYNPRKYGLPVGHDKDGREIVARGAWGEWLESMDIHQRIAQQFIKVFNELGGRARTSSFNIGLQALYEIATLPPEEREKEHTVPSTGEKKTVDEMTVRELREVKKVLKEREELLKAKDVALQEERERRLKVESENTVLKDTLESINADARQVNEDSRKEFYAEFINELEFIKNKYGAIALEGYRLRKAVEGDADLCEKLDSFDDFWKAFSKSIFKDEIIIDMEVIN